MSKKLSESKPRSLRITGEIHMLITNIYKLCCLLRENIICGKSFTTYRNLLHFFIKMTKCLYHSRFLHLGYRYSGIIWQMQNDMGVRSTYPTNCKILSIVVNLTNLQATTCFSKFFTSIADSHAAQLPHISKACPVRILPLVYMFI